MSKKRVTAGVIASVLLFGAAYLWLGSSTPQGQDPLSRLAPSSFARFEESFDKSSEGPRLVLLLSPT